MKLSGIPEQRQRFLMMISICAGAFISHFTAGIVNVSLPNFTQIFHTNLGIIQWITTGYLLVIASVLPIMGKLGDRYGHRFIHNLGYVIFTVSSVLVAFSPDIRVLLILRVMQAMGTAMFQATNIALITIHLPKEKRGRALGIVSTAVALGGMTGPFAGGLIAEWFSWQWLFLVHVPVAVVATWMALRYIPAREQEYRSEPLDSVGAFLFIIVIGSIILGLTDGNTWGWRSTEIISIFSVALMALLGLLLWELRQKTPFLPIKALAIPAVSGGLIISCTSFVLANTVLVVMPFYLSGLSGISPLSVGFIMTAYPLLLAFAGPVAGHMSDRFSSRRFMFLGLCGMGVGLMVFSIGFGQLPLVWIILVMALMGMGMGFVASPNNSFIMQHAPKEHVGSIGGMIALTRNLGMVLGAALGLGVMNGGEVRDQVPLDAFRSIFEIAVLICIVGIGVLGFSSWLEKRRNRKTKNETSKQFS